ncbi:kinase-like protein [Patellaria atrata CBS 101060]|uniref:mitogen-activated protein kinase kinase n=1 Tax=Patellaria atrata CBS 101060 TaxID=1346257 RepID=A0A9P4SKG0_9PEZI|nr:kinase-like protein [Patellaria atrata CBS 101060]
MAAVTPDQEIDSDSAASTPGSPSPVSSPFAPPPAAHSIASATSLEPPSLSPRSMSASATTGNMTTSSTPLGTLNAARRPHPPPISSRASGLNVSQDIQAKMKALQLSRQGAPRPQANPLASPPGQGVTSPVSMSSAGGPVMGPGGIPAGFKMPPNLAKPNLMNFQSAPAVPNLHMGGKKPSLAEKRGMRMPGGLPGAPSPTPAAKKKPGLTLSQMNAGADGNASNGPSATQGSMMDKYSEYIDKETGTLRFKGKATINAQGVEFSGGSTFKISLDEVDTLDELGKGNYGTVYKVRHARPKIRRPGQGLAGNKLQPSLKSPDSPTNKSSDDNSPTSATSGGTTGVIMAMKEIRLELDDAKFAAIIMELDILHRCVSPHIVDFYGAFFQEGAVYICMEFMDGGSIDKLYGDGIPENVLRKIALATTQGLKSLKDDHNIIHRDVKPTNILMNTKGQVKICDFGVSGNLVASIAKTNIGCQSYMAPERISSGGIAQAGANPGGGTYSVQSDIWSLGLTLIESALGRYPYPPETYNNIFSQLSAIVDGEPPDLPAEGYSEAARNFVRGCLHKIPNLRPTYAMLLQHAWLAPLAQPSVIMEEDEEAAEAAAASGAPLPTAIEDINASTASVSGVKLPPDVVDKEVAEWVITAIEKRRAGKMGKSAPPPLHAAPLDAVVSPMKEIKQSDVTATS